MDDPEQIRVQLDKNKLGKMPRKEWTRHARKYEVNSERKKEQTENKTANY